MDGTPTSETSMSWCFQVKVRLEKLATFAADFVGSAHFEDVPFELTLTTEALGGPRAPRAALGKIRSL